MINKILVINAGSSSIKWSLFNEENLDLLASGLAERINVDGNLVCKFAGQVFEKKVGLKDHEEAVREILQQWSENNIVESIDDIKVVGFRVVNAGPDLMKSTIITDEVLFEIHRNTKLAPLHNPGAIQSIKAFQKLLPNAKLTMTVDTGFHATIPKINYSYAIDKDLAKEYSIRKYGFHGVSHRFVTLKLQEILNKEKVNFVNLHLGNGSSLCAIQDSKSIDTTMGFTPLSGVMMGTRSGDVDPSIVLYLSKELNIDAQEATDILNKKSGLLGVSGISSDMRDLEKVQLTNENARFALDLFAQKSADYLALYLNKIAKKLDAIVFTAGIGENDPLTRQNIINRIHSYNVKLSEKNTEKFDKWSLISSDDSEIPVFVIRTNEELMIATDAKELTTK
ncbi:acetate/propionate family kinase [Mycoplasma zalophi]|uniref:acetate/propionate family kinase n=1 Tax=Mycoplasma zalophi TaxID=191287 RepID=UPI0021C7DEEA|nr:acetate/propionate family kinase [Mycoplasma zalophi]MCU4117412.1 acetate/propionate family kinase [Mycoplasma zalophi]